MKEQFPNHPNQYSDLFKAMRKTSDSLTTAFAIAYSKENLERNASQISPRTNFSEVSNNPINGGVDYRSLDRGISQISQPGNYLLQSDGTFRFVPFSQDVLKAVDYVDTVNFFLTAGPDKADLSEKKFDSNYPSSVYAGKEDDSITGKKDGNNRIFGGAGNDILIGGDQNDVIFGGKDNDDIYSGKGDDFLSPGSGIDNIIINGTGNKIIEGFDPITDIIKIDSKETGITSLLQLSKSGNVLSGAGINITFSNGIIPPDSNIKLF